MEMVWQYHDGLDREWIALYAVVKGCSQAIDVFDEQGLPLLGNNGEEVVASGLVAASVIHSHRSTQVVAQIINSAQVGWAKGRARAHRRGNLSMNGVDGHALLCPSYGGGFG